nr:PREDICTED: aromatic peroxygenase-like [Bemisia tabaci]
MTGLKMLLLLAVVNRVMAAGISVDELARRIDGILRVKRELLDTDPGPNIAHEYVSGIDEILRIKRELPDVSSGPIEISVDGVHEWRAPGPFDERGPCPGLNALANHGYIPRSGVVSIGEATSACWGVLGMGLDAALVLSVYASLVCGLLPSFSIGGKSKNNSLGLGDCQGLKNTHNRMEGDVSPTRRDKYVDGDSTHLYLPYFKQLLDMTTNDTITYENMTNFRKTRLMNSINTNPYLLINPVTFFLAILTYLLPLRCLFKSNYPSCTPKPCIDHGTMMSFFAVSRNDNGSLAYFAGHEQIPENWYRVPYGEEYDLKKANEDVIATIVNDPTLLKFGGNTGENNSFVGVDVGDLSGGLYNAKNLLEGNNLQCFIYQNLQLTALSSLTAIFGKVTESITPVVEKLLDTIFGGKLTLGCPKLQDQPSLFSGFPGYSMSNASCSANTTGYD